MKINVKTLLLMLFTVTISSSCSENSVTDEISSEILNTNTEESTTNNTKTTDQNVIFEDNFDQTDRIPDKTKWKLCPQMPGDSWGNFFSMSYDQAYVENGNLILKAEKVNGVYKTGGVWTQNLFDFTYGKVEVRAKLKTAKGGLPAIWLLASSGKPSEGEIDMMEQYDNESIVYHTAWNNYTINLKNYDPVRQTTSKIIANEYNTYTLEWTPEKLVYSVNGKVSLTYPNLHLADEVTADQWPYKKNFFLILNYTLTMNGIITDAELPAIMQVDWVKVTKTV